MEDGSFSFAYAPLQRYEKDVVMEGDQGLPFGVKDCGGMDLSPSSKYGFYQENMAEKEAHLCKDQEQKQQKQQQQQQPISNYCVLSNDFQFNVVSSPSFQSNQERIKLKTIQTDTSDFVQPNRQRSYPFSSTSLEILSNYVNGLNKLKGGNLGNISTADQTDMGGQKISTEEIIRVAGARHIEFSAHGNAEYNMFMHPFGFGLSYSGLSEEENHDVELAQLLLAAAEKVGNQQFECASRLLTSCDWLASDTSNPVRRIVYYFARALRERIDIETGRISAKRFEEKGSFEMVSGLSSNIPVLVCSKVLPFNQVTLFTGIQAIVECVATASKVHLIDLGIRSGVQWTVLMQALAERDEFSVELIKVTAIGTTEKEKMEETGKRLENFAKSVNLNFSFQVVFLSDMIDVKEEQFEIEADEVVVVYSTFVLRTMISRPSCLDNLMGVIKKLNPSMMVVTEIEANHNSPSFANRFIEALFFYSAFFDCLEACMDQNDQHRMIIETLLSEGIRNTAAGEGEVGAVRNVKIDVWREFFARFGMLETEFSESSLYQASLVVKQSVGGNSCTLDTNGKSLIVGWKGTPINSLSVWKFC